MSPDEEIGQTIIKGLLVLVALIITSVLIIGGLVATVWKVWHG